MKKGAATTGGLALVGSMTAATTTAQQQADSAYIFSYDYHPGRPFQVLVNLQQEVVDVILGQQVQGQPVISDTADFNAYIANYQGAQTTGPGEYFLVFTQEAGLQPGQMYTFQTGASFFAGQFNLLEVGLSAGAGGGGGGGGGNQTVDSGGNQTTGSANQTDGGAGDTGEAGGDDT
ncbi:hypothetical protein GCM10028856_14760 [Halopiger thermotolerans]